VLTQHTELPRIAKGVKLNFRVLYVTLRWLHVRGQLCCRPQWSYVRDRL